MLSNENESLQKKNKHIKNEDIIDSYDYLSNAASTTDCTGLIPAGLTSKAELEAYESLYKFRPPELPVQVERT